MGTIWKPEFFLRKTIPVILLISFLLMIPIIASTQNNDTEKKEFNEWKEVFKLRHNFGKNKFGSRYVLGLFDGRFIGPNNEDNYGIRTYTTAYDYLLFGNSMLSYLASFGFKSDNIIYLPSKVSINHHPFYLGCIWHYSISEIKFTVDSSYNSTIGKNVAVDKPYKSTIPKLKIDSSQVKVELAGFCKKRKLNNKTVYDTLFLPQIEGTGSWKDANNFDMIYEWFETFFLNYADKYDISNRTFSKKTPKTIQQCILQRFNTRKYLDENQLTEDQLNCRLTDLYKNDIFDILHQPNEKIIRIGNYEMFRYFNDVYWRDINETVIIKGKRINENGQPVTYAYVWKPGDKKNPVWHNAFQYDKDIETNPESGLVNFIMIPYGTKGRNMPTVIPNNYPAFSQFEGVVLWQEGCEKQGYSNNDDLWINTLNGRMIDRGFYCYPYEVGILPLNDDGTVDGIYKIYVWKDDKAYWAYIYCGKHAGVRGGKPGKSFVDQVDSFRKSYDFSDYWYFYKEVDFKKDVVDNMPVFINSLENLMNRVVGIGGKTIPKIHVPIVHPDEKNPKKSRTDNYYVFLNGDNTGTLYPEKLNFVWNIEQFDDYNKNNELIRKKSVLVNLAGKNIVLEDVDGFLKSNKFTSGEVRKANEQFVIYQQNSRKKTTVINLNEVYNNRIFNLANSEETLKLIDIIKEDIQAVEYELPKAEKSLTDWQDENQIKLDELKRKLKEYEDNKKTKKDFYKLTKEEHDKLQMALDKKLFRYNKLSSRESMLQELLLKCYERLDVNLKNDLEVIQSKIRFLKAEKIKYENQLKQLKAEGKTNTDNYFQVTGSIDNKKQELFEAEEKMQKIQEMIEKQSREKDKD